MERATVETLLEIDSERQEKLNTEPIEDMSSIERNAIPELASCYDCQKTSVANINVWGYQVEAVLQIANGTRS